MNYTDIIQSDSKPDMTHLHSQFISLMFDHLPLGILIKNVDQCFSAVSWNQKFESIFQLKKGSWEQGNVLSAIPEDLKHKWQTDDARFLFSKCKFSKTEDSTNVNGWERFFRSWRFTLKSDLDQTTYLIQVIQDIGEKKRYEKKLHLYHKAIESAQEGVIILEAGTSRRPITYCNMQFAKLIGLPTYEIWGNSLETLLEFKDPLEIECLQYMLSTGRAASRIYTIYTDNKPHKEVKLKINLSPVKDDKGGIQYTIGIVSDVTSEEHLKENLRKNEENALRNKNKIQKILDTIAECVLVINKEGHILESYNTGELLLSPSVGNQPMHLQEFLATEVTEFFKYKIQKSIDESTQEKFEFELVDHLGRNRLYQARILRLNATSAVASLRDSTEEIRMREELNHTLKQFNKIANNVPGAIVQYRLNMNGVGEFSYVNERFEEIFGFKAEHLINEPEKILNTVVHPDDREALVAELTNAILKTQSFQIKMRIIQKNGDVRWILAIAIPEAGKSHQICWDGLVFDVSSEVEAQETITKQQENMFYSSKLASLGEMAGGIAHEINNPLAIIDGYGQRLLELARTDRLTLDKTVDLAQKITRTTERIAKIVRSLNVVARDGCKDAFEETDLRIILKDTLELCREKFKNKGIYLKISIPPYPCRAHVQRIQISQVILNLLNNACDAVLDSDTKAKQIELELVKQNYDDYTIAVRDNGNGIPAHLSEKIMQPFFTTKEIGKGTGLGLSVSKSIIENHHGTISIQSTPGNTEFTVTLPQGLLAEECAS